MSSYAQVTDLLKFGLSQAALNTASTDPAVQQGHLDAASALADGYLNAKFKLPLVSWGLDLKQKVCEIAAFTLIDFRGFDPESPADKPIYDRYLAAIRWLERITEGEVTPVVVDSNPVPGQFGGPSILQMNTSPSTTQPSGGGTLTLVDGGVNGSNVVVGSPRQRGWR